MRTSVSGPDDVLLGGVGVEGDTRDAVVCFTEGSVVGGGVPVKGNSIAVAGRTCVGS
jgi:hypothetical protein